MQSQSLKTQIQQVEQYCTVFQTIILQRLAYALPVWGPFLSVDPKHKNDGFLKRSYRHGFAKEIFHIQTITDSATYDQFNKAKASNHCLYHIRIFLKSKKGTYNERLLSSDRPHCRGAGHSDVFAR